MKTPTFDVPDLSLVASTPPSSSVTPSVTPPEVPQTPNMASAPRLPTLCRLSQLLDVWAVEAEAAYEARQRGRARGPVTGFTKLDTELGGFLCAGLHIVHGQPGAGKTAFVWQIAAACGTPALFVSCEMGALELMRRHTARETGTFLGRFKTGEIAPPESLSLARRAVEAAPLLALADATQAPAPARYLLECAQVVQGDHPHLLIVIDSVHSWAEGLANGATEYETLNAGLSALRQMAHRLNCPILVVSERNRESMSGGGLSAGAGSRKIEYGAETVLDLSRDAEARPDGTGNVPIKARLAKNRHGAAGKTISFTFNGALQKFSPAP